MIKWIVFDDLYSPTATAVHCQAPVRPGSQKESHQKVRLRRYHLPPDQKRNVAIALDGSMNAEKWTWMVMVHRELPYQGIGRAYHDTTARNAGIWSAAYLF